jgi:type I restriction enzyme, S subunit
MTAKSHEVARKTLNLEDVRTAVVAVPPLAEQERIVAEVERRLSVVEEMEATVEASLRRAERLRQTILKRGFEGRLVPQDPSDEPASALLARIRAERAQREGTQVSRRGGAGGRRAGPRRRESAGQAALF